MTRPTLVECLCETSRIVYLQGFVRNDIVVLILDNSGLIKYRKNVERN